MALFAPASPPPTRLGRYRKLSSTAGVHVSPLLLGAMSIGDKWAQFGMGAMDKESSFKLLDAYFDNGGNFIDTVNAYQDGSSEEFIGEWAEKREIRDQLFIATKYTNSFVRGDDSIAQKVLFAGNSTKSLHTSLKTSLARLRTDYVDLLYVHWWDYETSVEEVMRGLHNLVVQGKVLYMGVSDTPAWVVARANEYARCHALTPFVIYQGSWNILDRSFERDIIPMAKVEGMALAPFNVLAQGKFRTDEEEKRRLETGELGRRISRDWLRNDKEKEASRVLEKIAQEIGAKNITSVAIAYVMHKAPFVFPIIGGRKVEHLLQNVEALEITLTDSQIAELESVADFELGFPHSMIGTGHSFPKMLTSVAVIDRQPPLPIIRPSRD
ncbi:aryl-alcohol dehydrogenase [Coprinopsis sp. MPI-PUGE-AT-0042]|nr:aryl-alcohol dehydrogenase [Coprinopsis sp. MPI-PUGE-AT-0042]